MTVYIKSGGAWRAASNGRLWIRSGGAWRVANYCHIKSGGAWRDSGYRGFPAAPTGLYVTAWDFANVSMAFSAGSGGAPVDHYVAEKLNSAGTVVASQNSAGSFTFGVSQNEQCQFRVYAVSTGGITSRPVDGGPGYSNTVRTLIGHAEQGYWGSQLAQRDWGASVGFGSGRHRDEVVQFYVPNSVVITSRHFVFGLSFGGSYISTYPGNGNRQIYYVNWGAEADLMVIGGHDADFTNYDNIRGADTYWGFVQRGIGWSPVGGNESQLLLGAFYMTGREDYYVSVWVVTVAYAGNSYW